MACCGTAKYKYVDKNSKNRVTSASCVIDESIVIGSEQANYRLYNILKTLCRGTNYLSNGSDFTASNFTFTENSIPYQNTVTLPDLCVDLYVIFEYIGSSGSYAKTTIMQQKGITLTFDGSDTAITIANMIDYFTQAIIYDTDLVSVKTDWQVKSATAFVRIKEVTPQNPVQPTQNNASEQNPVQSGESEQNNESEQTPEQPTNNESEVTQ